MQVEINEKIYKNILSYCQLNEIDCNEYINMLLKKGFNVDRYGDKPFFNPDKDNIKPECKNDEEPKVIVTNDNEDNSIKVLPEVKNIDENKEIPIKVEEVVTKEEEVCITETIDDNSSEILNEEIDNNIVIIKKKTKRKLTK